MSATLFFICVLPLVNWFAGYTYVIRVDMPGHVAIGDQLTIDVASDLGVPPAVVDMDDADHVPLKVQRKHGDRKWKKVFQTKGC